MIVRVRLFAALKQATGREVFVVDMPDGATIGQLRRRMAEDASEMSELLRRAMFAVGAEYATDDCSIPPDSDVACIPPVSGG